MSLSLERIQVCSRVHPATRIPFSVFSLHVLHESEPIIRNASRVSDGSALNRWCCTKRIDDFLEMNNQVCGLNLSHPLISYNGKSVKAALKVKGC